MNRWVLRDFFEDVSSDLDLLTGAGSAFQILGALKKDLTRDRDIERRALQLIKITSLLVQRSYYYETGNGPRAAGRPLRALGAAGPAVWFRSSMISFAQTFYLLHSTGIFLIDGGGCTFVQSRSRPSRRLLRLAMPCASEAVCPWFELECPIFCVALGLMKPEWPWLGSPGRSALNIVLRPSSRVPPSPP